MSGYWWAFRSPDLTSPIGVYWPVLYFDLMDTPKPGPEDVMLGVFESQAAAVAACDVDEAQFRHHFSLARAGRK